LLIVDGSGPAQDQQGSGTRQDFGHLAEGVTCKTPKATLSRIVNFSVPQTVSAPAQAIEVVRLRALLRIFDCGSVTVRIESSEDRRAPRVRFSTAKSTIRIEAEMRSDVLNV
jgi:hypothetical protein